MDPAAQRLGHGGQAQHPVAEIVAGFHRVRVNEYSIEPWTPSAMLFWNAAPTPRASDIAVVADEIMSEFAGRLPRQVDPNIVTS